MNDLSHLDEQGRARMVDVGGKAVTERVARAVGRIEMQPATRSRILHGAMPKGDVLATARLAGIMAAKKTADLIPLCHPLPLTSAEVTFTPSERDDSVITIHATCKVAARTGVEMEALTAVSVAALTLYDMCKAIDRDMRITGIRLLHKSGGRSGIFEAPETPDTERGDKPDGSSDGR